MKNGEASIFEVASSFKAFIFKLILKFMNICVILRRIKMLVELLRGGASISDGPCTVAGLCFEEWKNGSEERAGEGRIRDSFGPEEGCRGLPARFGKSCGDVVGEDERGVSEAG